MRIGVIGAGNIGRTLARHLAKLGHQVSIANSRGPESLNALAAEIGATPVSVVDAAKAGEIVIISIPEKAVADLPRELFAKVPSSVAVIDTGGSLAVGLRLKAAIRAKTPLPIRYVINTHMHPDHVFGNAAFSGDGAVFAGHDKLKRALAVRGETYLRNYRTLIGEPALAGTTVVLPELAVSGRMELDLGGRVIELTAYATAHTDNDLTVRDPATRTLFTGDLLFVRHLPVLDGNLNGWLAASEELAKVDAARAVPGHGALQRDWPAALEAQRAYLARLRDDVRAALKDGRTMQQATAGIPPEQSGGWALIEDFHRRNVTAGYAELEWE